MKNDKITDLDNHFDLKFPSSPDDDMNKDVLQRIERPSPRISFPFLDDDILKILRKRCKQPLLYLLR